MMDRRQVLRLLLSGAAAAAVDPDSALWIPGRKKIFIPPARALSVATIAEALDQIHLGMQADYLFLSPRGIYMIGFDGHRLISRYP